MKDTYRKPLILADSELAEGIYTSSGAETISATGTVTCESVYMNGVWQAADYSSWVDGESRGYKQQFGCLGCRANRSNGCGLLTDYVSSGYASSYESDIGYYKPSWEQKGYGPNDVVTDWNM